MEGYIGEIRLFAGNFAPRNWAYCQGQLLSIAQNTALFSILGTTYGGNGQTTFGLPNLSGRTAVGTGTGPGLPNIQLGEMSGAETVTLLQANLPSHSHSLVGSASPATATSPQGAMLAATSSQAIYATGTPSTALSPQAVSPAGSSQPVSIRNPYLGMNYIICLYGTFPSRN